MTDLLSKQKQIQQMIKEKVIGLQDFGQRKGFFQNFFQLIQVNTANLSKNIFGDFSYQRKNRYTVQNKLKILDYLKQKYLLLSHNLNENNKKNYYNYDADFFSKVPQNLNIMKQMVLKGKSQVEAAQDSLQRLKKSRDFIRAQFLNEAAYQFDRQRYCSIFWGMMAGSLINSTIYKKGRTTRKAALFITIAHIFGQISYHVNLDRYFDSVHQIFEQEAQKYMKTQKQNQKSRQKVFIKNSIQQ